jgi:hypothetical protein
MRASAVVDAAIAPKKITLPNAIMVFRSMVVSCPFSWPVAPQSGGEMPWMRSPISLLPDFASVIRATGPCAGRCESRETNNRNQMTNTTVPDSRVSFDLTR